MTLELEPLEVGQKYRITGGTTGNTPPRYVTITEIGEGLVTYYDDTHGFYTAQRSWVERSRRNGLLGPGGPGTMCSWERQDGGDS